MSRGQFFSGRSVGYVTLAVWPGGRRRRKSTSETDCD